MFRSFRNYFFAGAVIASMIAVAPPVLAQSSGAASAPKKTFRESSREKREQLEQQREKKARIKAKQEADWRAAMATKRKRDACKKQAKAQQLHLLKRRRFLKKCMAES